MKASKGRLSTDATYAPYEHSSKQFQPPLLPKHQNASTFRQLQTSTLAAAQTDIVNQSTYKVARAISSCTRCRSRKQKCDGKLPACSACERAKVECIGIDAISKTNISRNYLHQLEQEVESLRAQVATLTSRDPIAQTQKEGIAATAFQAASTFHPDFPIDPSLTQNDPSPLRSPMKSSSFPGPSNYQRRSASNLSFPTTSAGADPSRSPFSVTPRPHPTGQAASLYASSLTCMVHDAALRTGHAANSGTSLNPTASMPSGSDRGSVHSGFESPFPGGDTKRTSPEAVLTPHPVATLDGLPTTSPYTSSTALFVNGSTKPKRKFVIPPLPPKSAVERLVAAYVNFVGVTGPIIHLPTLSQQLAKIREGVDVEEEDIFVVMMVLALSTIASSTFMDPPDELRACSEAFYAEAMKHLDAVFEEQSYVGLQAILLLIWYSLFNPDKGSIWFLVGLATRTCVDLGYHNEHNTSVDQLDALELDMRRRLFWCTYKMDRLLSQSLGRPPSIPDGFIKVPLPSVLHDNDIRSGDFGTSFGEPCPYKAIFIHTIKLRQLQSEILFNTYGVHGSNGKIPNEEWFEDCHKRLEDWLNSTPEPRGTVSMEGYAISFHNSCLLLFRPSPGCTRPCRKALSVVLTSSKYIIQIYQRKQINNRISCFWMTSHFSFMAGLSFLYAFFNLYSMGGGQDVPTIEDAMAHIESCLGVLEFLSPRVPSALACHETMRLVSQAIFKQLADLSRPTSQSTSSSDGRPTLLRGAPISSLREDPLPNEAFPAPLPAVTLPYEFSLLDNLFRNPVVSHKKASDYTSNKRYDKQPQKQGDFQEGANVGVKGYNNPKLASENFPPGAFHTNNNSSLETPKESLAEEPNSLFRTYGMASRFGLSPDTAPWPMFPLPTTSHPNPGLTALANTAASVSSTYISQTQNGEKGMVNGSLFINGEGEYASLDIFNFLLNDDGGVNEGYVDIPADFSLWS
ncbi:uncharacterized protein L203_105775 [Cryptococcus depauperatus CBS 7841]|uniref:Uncharacterized protein n=1 Tax=Cryptococcus depauperatus CBS 7841 TaxID=1295531 RepID=A0A1E3I9Q9_9TREE|nr:fungal specific transcription factor [Cryptococcus depauperatus CBS 7841]